MSTRIEPLDEFCPYKEILKERREARAAADQFVRACKAGKSDLLIQKAFLRVWIDMKTLPLRVGDHRALCKAARVLMPSYSGPALRLFRGTHIRERRLRTYGIPWTSDRNTAETFAERNRDDVRNKDRGGVLLQTKAPRKAIICAIGKASGHSFKENEYAVDRRHLGDVRVVRRYLPE